jgi:hypothetical protein
MPRLGELLVAAGRITAAQLDEGLRAQVLYGGRLGTNLVELFHLELDAIALALARQHGVPAALGKHFERCDVTVQQRLSPELANRWSVVPIGRLADRRERIAIASCDPLSHDALAEIAHALAVPGDALIISIAAELRIRYYLERAYRIARGSRYLRVRRETQHEIPVAPPEDLTTSDVGIEVEVELDADPDATGTTVLTPTGQIPRRAPARAETDDEPTISRSFTEPPPEIELDPEVEEVLASDKRRRFVRTIADGDADVSEPIELDTGPAAPAAWGDKTPFARIAIKKASSTAPRFASVDDAARAIRRATSREKVGELVVRSAMQFGGIDAVALFVVREPIAIGWMGEVRGAEPAIDEIAIPLDAPSAIARAFRDGAALRVDLARGDVTELDRRLLDALGGPAPARVAVAPVAIGGQAVCVFYAHGGSDPAPLVEALAEAASAAFVRLLRQAQR